MSTTKIKTCTDAELADLLSSFGDCETQSHLDDLAVTLAGYELTKQQRAKASGAYAEAKARIDGGGL